MKWVTSRRGKCCIGISKSSAEVQARQHMTTNEAEQHCIKCNMNGIASMKTLTRTLICMWTHSRKHSVLINKCCYHFEVPKRPPHPLLQHVQHNVCQWGQRSGTDTAIANTTLPDRYLQYRTISYKIHYHTISININQYQSISTNINQYQTTSININQYQPISTNIKQYQSISNNIDQYQPISTTINQYQSISTNINQYSINQYQSISININQYHTRKGVKTGVAKF